MKLSILIPSLESRTILRKALVAYLDSQAALEGLVKDEDYEILIDVDRGELSIGAKRNKLLQSAKGDYVCFIDDDDWVSQQYFKRILEGIKLGVDCCSLRGVITWDGENPEIFEHSIIYDAYKTNDTGPIKYERYPNHLNAIKSSIAKRFCFNSVNHGEDTDWATQIFRSGLIKSEHPINEVIYEYRYKRK